MLPPRDVVDRHPLRRLAGCSPALLLVLLAGCDGRKAVGPAPGGGAADASRGRGNGPAPNLDPDAGQPPDALDSGRPPGAPDGSPPAVDAAPAPPPDAPWRDGASPSPPVADAAPDARLDMRPTPPPPDASGPDMAPTCAGPADCGRGSNCSAGRCLPAPVSCRAYKTDNPAAGDGVYWINPAGVPLRAYCDMRERVELCTELEGERRGITRDPARLVFRMMAVLDAGEGICRLWALRASDGHPLDVFFPIDPARPVDTCAMLGFVSSGALPRCLYGSDAAQGYSNCGFPVGAYLRWGNHCRGCQQNDGDHDRYLLQGPMTRGEILGTFDGAQPIRCRVR